jgi:hypothetical protein
MVAHNIAVRSVLQVRFHRSIGTVPRERAVNVTGEYCSACTLLFQDAPG